jgi:hypothetical protein
MATLTAVIWLLAAVALFLLCHTLFDEADEWIGGTVYFFPFAMVMAFPSMFLGSAILKDVYGSVKDSPPSAQGVVLGLSMLGLSSLLDLLARHLKRKPAEPAEPVQLGKTVPLIVTVVNLIASVLGILSFYLTHLVR